MEEYKIKAEHYKLFVKECKIWIDRFGLKEYGTEFRKVLCNDGSLAFVEFNEDYTLVRISLNTIWPSKPTTKEIKKTALHEMVHVLTMGLQRLATERFITENSIYDEIEKIARRMENAIYE